MQSGVLIADSGHSLRMPKILIYSSLTASHLSISTLPSSPASITLQAISCHFFAEKRSEKFGGIRNKHYLCTRNSEMSSLIWEKRRGVAQPGSAPGLGPGGRRFESCRPDLSLTL